VQVGELEVRIAILGLPPLNQYDLAATDLRDLFTNTPDFTPYSLQKVIYAKGANKTWTELAKHIDFSRPDADEVKLHAGPPLILVLRSPVVWAGSSGSSCPSVGLI
jgi:hypothetical protein